jgi:hypothetical protein
MGSSAVVVKESAAQRDGLFGFLVAAFGLALVRGAAGAHTVAGRAAAALVFGALVVLCLVLWARTRMRPDRLEISQEAIRYVSGSGRQKSALNRQQGDNLCFVAQGGGRVWRQALKVRGSGAVMPLRFFSRAAVKRACEAQGWRFD